MELIVIPGFSENENDLYRVLQVHQNAAPEVIRAAYRALMSDVGYHPDLGGSSEQAILLNQAYETLSNPTERAKYDAFNQYLNANKQSSHLNEPRHNPPLDLHYTNRKVNAATTVKCDECGALNTITINPTINMRGTKFHCGLCRNIVPLRQDGERARERKPVEIPSRCETANGAKLTGRIIDLSDSGARVILDNAPEIGTLVTLRTAQFVAEGRVMWLRKKSSLFTKSVYVIGISFSDFLPLRAQAFINVEA